MKINNDANLTLLKICIVENLHRRKLTTMKIQHCRNFYNIGKFNLHENLTSLKFNNNENLSSL